MVNGYDAIPGTSASMQMPYRSRSRFGRFSEYKTYIISIGFIVLIIGLATLASYLIGSAVLASEEESEPANLTHADSTDRLLSVTWPRRDEIWYKNRWRKRRMREPFSEDNNTEVNERIRYRRSANNTHSKSHHFYDSRMHEEHANKTMNRRKNIGYRYAVLDLTGNQTRDGSTFPKNDTFHWGRNASSVPSCSVKLIGQCFASASESMRSKKRLERNLVQRNISLSRGSPSYLHQKGFRRTSRRALSMAETGYKMDHATREICTRLNLTREQTTFDSRWLGDLSDSPYCERRNTKCSERNRYRSIDGSCNNLEHPMWGASLTRFRRAMPPDYADGISKPRTSSMKGRTLPSARLVSIRVHKYKRTHSRSYTHLTMSWGQFIDHDITSTAQAKGQNGSTLACCQTGTNGSTSAVHPECFPIYIPEEDDFFRSRNSTCMEFSRSAAAPRCHFGPRHQLNQNTHFLDGSVIYGSSVDQMEKLRQFKEGLLKTQITTDGRALLPPSLNPNDSCNTEDQMRYKQYCFVSGDSRVNEVSLLTIMHTLWVLHHNSVAEGLRDLNLHWDDEKLFQETRRIVVAQIQHITYNEYLPSIIGPRLYHGLRLNPSDPGDYWAGYSADVHPGIANGFAAAAYRFGHSMVQGLVQSIDETGEDIAFEQLKKFFFNPFGLYDPKNVGRMIRGEVSQSAAAVDTYFTTQLTNRLFQTAKSDYGLDLVAINIQRGRDHGIPSYTRWRMMCGLRRVKTFKDLGQDMDKGALNDIRTVYKHVDDIDLYTGGLAEKPIKDGLVGPTFACIIADQFLRLKIADRFWYENPPHRNGFTQSQLHEIRKTTLAGMLCKNVLNLGSIQPWPLRRFATDNQRKPCHDRSIPVVSLNPWEEENDD